MKFLINFGFPNFVRSLGAAPSEVYKAVYTENNGTEAHSIVLLTSDVNGTLHVLRISIRAEKALTMSQADEALELAADAGDKIEQFLKSKGVTLKYGLLLTAGLQEALRYWGGAT